MSFTYGFFNSLNHDRLYDADQFSHIFDGIIQDGVYEMIGTAMMVTENSGMKVNVGIGRAHFNSRWMNNDSIMPITIAQSSQVLDRYDAVILEVNESSEARTCAVKVIMGEEATTPTKPTMTNTDMLHQYPLAYIYIKANATSIANADITNCVGTSECPFVTGIIQQLTIDELLAQWQSEWNIWKASHVVEFDTWEVEQKAAFREWFSNLQDELDSNQVGHLQNQIDKIREMYDEEVDALFGGSGSGARISRSPIGASVGTLDVTDVLLTE